MRHAKGLHDDDINKGFWDTFTKDENAPAKGMGWLHLAMIMVYQSVFNILGVVPVAMLQGGVWTDVTPIRVCLANAWMSKLHLTLS